MGGLNEREISLISEKYVYDSLISSGINAIKLDLKNNLDSIKYKSRQSIHYFAWKRWRR